MNNRHLRLVILLGVFVLSGLLIVQIYWFQKAFSVAEKQFDHTVQVALLKVADSVSADAGKKIVVQFLFCGNRKQPQ